MLVLLIRTTADSFASTRSGHVSTSSTTVFRAPDQARPACIASSIHAVAKETAIADLMIDEQRIHRGESHLQRRRRFHRHRLSAGRRKGSSAGMGFATAMEISTPREWKAHSEPVANRRSAAISANSAAGEMDRVVACIGAGPWRRRGLQIETDAPHPEPTGGGEQLGPIIMPAHERARGPAASSRRCCLDHRARTHRASSWPASVPVPLPGTRRCRPRVATRSPAQQDGRSQLIHPIVRPGDIGPRGTSATVRDDLHDGSAK